MGTAGSLDAACDAPRQLRDSVALARAQTRPALATKVHATPALPTPCRGLVVSGVVVLRLL